MNARWLALALVVAAASLPPALATPPLPAPPPPSPPATAETADTPAVPGVNSCPLGIPRGANVLVNGSFAPNEWNDAEIHPLDAEHELLMKRDGRYVYLGIRFLGPRHTGLELYLASGGEMRALHVSSALADRRRGPEGWSEHVWENPDWGANTIGVVSGEGGQKLLEPEGFEIQLSRAAMTGKQLALRIELKRPDAVFPAGTTDGDTKGWIRIQI